MVSGGDPPTGNKIERVCPAACFAHRVSAGRERTV